MQPILDSPSKRALSIDDKSEPDALPETVRYVARTVSDTGTSKLMAASELELEQQKELRVYLESLASGQAEIVQEINRLNTVHQNTDQSALIVMKEIEK